MKKTKVAIVIFDEFTDLDFFLSWDLLNRVRTLCNDSSFVVDIAGTNPTHTSKAGLEIKTTCSIAATSEFDAVIISSGPKSRLLCDDKIYLSQFQLNPEKQLIASICSGAVILGALGLLKGMKATTYPTAVNLLRSFDVTVVSESFVEQGNIATAAACLAGRDIAYWLIEKLRGKEIARQVDDSIRPLNEVR